MKLVRIPVQVTKLQKAYLDVLRSKGTTASGYIRSLLEQALTGQPVQPLAKPQRRGAP